MIDDTLTPQQIAWGLISAYPLSGQDRVQLASAIAREIAQGEDRGKQQALSQADREIRIRNSIHMPGCTCDLCREARYAE